MLTLVFIGLFKLPLAGFSYPIFDSEETEIRRLEAARLVQQGQLRGQKQPVGSLLPLDQVDIRLQDYPNLSLPTIDKELTRKVKRYLSGGRGGYSISILDLSDIDKPSYAEVNGGMARNPGSVGKILVATALFQALADVYPNDLPARQRILRETMITADQFIIYDHHEVRFWNSDRKRVRRRALIKGDQGSLWEYLDWMLSASSNAAASMVLKQAMLIRHYAEQYPVSDQQADDFFMQTSKKELSELLVKTIQDPVQRSQLDLEKLRQGSFFTRRGKQLVPGTNSFATTRELMQMMLKIEQGKLVDAFSSREIKRLLYMTERRIRYASHPALKESAVYFKSGSLYKCEDDPDPEFVCEKYHGNVFNLMNSVAIIETKKLDKNLHYIVTLTSNILKENSAVAHQTLAMRIHRLIEKRHKLIKK